MAALSDFLENKLIDYIFRAQTMPTFTTLYVALFTSAQVDAGGATEVSTSGTGYARAAVTCGLTQWSGTQSAVSTSVSSGGTGTTVNLNAIPFQTPTGSWGTIGWFGIYDAVTSGNLLIHGALTTQKTVGVSDSAPSFGIAQLSVQIDT